MNIWDAVVGYFWMSRIRQLPVLWINLYKNMFHLSHHFSPVYINSVQWLQKLYLLRTYWNKPKKLQSQKKVELQKLITGTDHLCQCFYLQYSPVVDPHFWGEIIFKDQLFAIFKTLLIQSPTHVSLSCAITCFDCNNQSSAFSGSVLTV